MASEKNTDDKSTDDKRVTSTSDISDALGKISVGSSPINVGSVVFGNNSWGRPISNVTQFTHLLHTLIELHPEKRGRLSQIIHTLFKQGREIEKVSSILELKDLMQILADQDFYKTASIEKQEKYIRIMLGYLIREVPQDYRRIVEYFLREYIGKVDVNQTDDVTKLILQRLAGDSSTDAPPPQEKKKPKGTKQ